MNVFASTTFAQLNSKATEIVDVMLNYGLAKIELGSIHCYESEVTSKLLAEPAQYLVHNYFPAPKKPFVVNIASLNDGIRQMSVEHILNSITFCKQIGASLYTFHPGFLSDPEGTTTYETNFDFRFRSEKPRSGAYELAFQRFIDAVGTITSHARSAGVQVAVESEGSVSKKDYLLLQRPEEFDRFFAAVPDPIVGINLNLGHLHLAANAFGFAHFELIDQIAYRIVAIEVSHNEGMEDEHRPLVEKAWYWAVVRDSRFFHVPVILETRKTSIETVRQMVCWLESERRPTSENTKSCLIPDAIS